MHVFWDTILRPILQAVKPKTIVEIGVERGRTTELLIPFCAETNATLHGIDPLPLIDESEWQEQWGDTWTLHRGRSLDILPTLPPFDAILIDGDHNWYTVFHELQLIHRHAELCGRTPVILLHDISAPYGRRDLYYDPETIPAEYRHAWERKGIDVDAGALAEHDGLNPHLCHAVHEGGAQNGVRTAVEDFLRETKEHYAFYEVHGFHGLGIVVPRTFLDRNPSLQKLMDDLSHSALLQKHIEQMEHDRLLRIPCAGNLDRALTELQRFRGECAKLAETIEQQLAEKKNIQAVHAAEAAAQRSMIERLTQTRSWRWTAWMRRVSGWMGRGKM